MKIDKVPDCGCHIQVEFVPVLPCDVDEVRSIVYCEMHGAAPELVKKCQKIVAWLDMLAKRCDKLAEDKRFITLTEANEADAKNYRATATDIRLALKKAGFQ